MNNTPICQSCAMPMQAPDQHGTESNGTPSADYCCYCYQNGAFGKDETMADMIETCIPFVVEANVYPDAESARAAMHAYFPSLKRWAGEQRG